LKTLSGGSFSGDNSLDKTHSDLLLESFAAVNDAGKNGRIDAPPDALRVKSSNIVKSDESASWYKDVPNPDKADKTQVLVVHAHIDEQAKDEDGVFVLPATQFRLVTKFKQDPLQAGKSYYPVGYLTCSGDPKTWELWTAPADEKSKLPDLTKLLVARNAKAGGLYVDWVYRIGEGETPTYMAFRRVAKAAVPAPPEDGKYTQLADEALEKKGAAQAPAAPQPAKQIKLALKAGSVVRPHSLQVSPKTGKATFIEVAALENTVHLFDLTAGKDMNLAKVIPGAVACTISPDGTQAIVRANDGVYLLNLASMKAVKASDPRTAAYWMGQKVVMSTIEDGNLGHMKTFIPPDGKIEEWQVSGAPLANNAAGNQILAAANPKAPKDPIPSNDLEATVSLVILDSAGHITKEIAPVAGANAPPIASNSLKWAALSSSSKDAAGKAHDKCTVFDVDHKSSTTIDSFAQPIGITDAGLVVAATEPGPDGFTIKTYQNGKTAILVKKVAVAALADNTVYYVTGTADKAVLTSIDLPK
jgi:hypothetical protein